MNLKHILFLFAILILSVPTFAQYSVKSPYLFNPELNIGFVDSSAAFWLKSYDETLDGFYTNVDRQGNVITAWGTNKDMISQSRTAYGLTRAYMLTGNKLYLQYAQKALEFMFQSAWDTVNSGWFNKIDRFGNPINPQENKTAFNQHYALLGILAYFEATNDSLTYSKFMDGFLSNETLLWDDDENLFGYYDYGNYNWSNKVGKSFNATVDAATTHLIGAYLLTEDNNIFKERLISVADNIVDRLTSTMDNYQIGFVEKFATDWTWNDNSNNYNTRTIMGHVLKAGWVLGRIYQVDPNPVYLEAAEKMVLQVWGKGYDHIYGGPFKDYDRVTGDMYFYGQDTAKAWWQIEQAIVAGLELYDITHKDIYLQMADESLNFFMKYFVDHTYGEIFKDLYSDGSIITAWGTHKGDGSKAGYHSIETGFYAYLYGNLFFNKQPVTLYYNIQPINKSVSRIIHLNPLAMNLVSLKIESVTLDGNEYTNFDPENRLLTVDQNVGGEFKVTFKIDETTSIVTKKEVIDDFSLAQNYPNPFNPTTTIKYSIPVVAANFASTTNVKLKVYDILGREIKVLVDEQQSAGTYKVKFKADNLASGIYIYSLNYGQYIETKKMILLN